MYCNSIRQLYVMLSVNEQNHMKSLIKKLNETTKSAAKTAVIYRPLLKYSALGIVSALFA